MAGEADVDRDAGRAPQKILETEQPRLGGIEVAELGHELFHVETPPFDHQIRSDRLARE